MLQIDWLQLKLSCSGCNIDKTAKFLHHSTHQLCDVQVNLHQQLSACDKAVSESGLLAERIEAVSEADRGRQRSDLSRSAERIKAVSRADLGG